MGRKIELDKENVAVLLFNRRKNDWEDRTMSVSSMYFAYYFGKFTGYNIYFEGADRYFFYTIDKVKFLKKVRTVDIENNDISIGGKTIKALKVNKFENGYYRIYTEKTTVFSKNVNIKSNKHKNIFCYYSKLADYAGKITEVNSPLFFLSQNYKRMHPKEDSVLFDYLLGAANSIDDTELLIVPFDYNQSQIKAIDNALKNKISVIEGPPGTGKTQTILNLIANIIYRGKNCAVVSNNNTAINNIYEKLNEEKLSFITANLGRQTNVKRFFESDQNSELTEFLQQDENPIQSETISKIKNISMLMKKIQDLEVDIAKFEAQLTEIINEKKHHDNIYDDAIKINQKLSSKDYLALITRLEKPEKIWFFEKWLLNMRFKIKIKLHNVIALIFSAEKLYYKSKIDELTKKIESARETLRKYNKGQVGEELKELCRLLFIEFIRKQYQNNNIKEFHKETYKYEFDDFLIRYPVVLSTSYSLLNNAPKGFTFDYLIIDEASQGDLLSSVLAMSCAKRLVVVGDSRQLQQIDEEILFPQSEKLAVEYNIPIPYRYESNSILKSVKDAIPDVPTTLLREHYRCAPDIINFCNKMFYDGELVAMTRNTGQHITIIKTVPGNHARRNPNGSGQYNQREIDEIGNILKESVSESIGIISPFRYQADLIAKNYTANRIEADTIHKFQGRQKEEIILSFVVNSLDRDPDNENNKLYNFVTNWQLLNVAISRGRKKVTAIVADKVYHSSNNVINDFIKYAEYLYGSDVVKVSTITSVFDILYSEYKAALISDFKKRPDHYKTELLMCDIIDQVLCDYKQIGYSMHTRLSKLVNVPCTFTDEEKRYILHPWSHVDFLFYNIVSKEKLFVLEVDGTSYHEKNKKQTEHDDIKNRVLESNNIPLFRFKTNESNERFRLTELMEKFSH